MSEMHQINSNPVNISKYKGLNIYFANEYEEYKIFKGETDDFDLDRIKREKLKLFITLEDRIKLIRNKQQSLNIELRKSIKYDSIEAKRILTDLVSVTLSDPRSAVLCKMKKLITKVVAEYLADPRVVANLVQISIHDYSTSLHLTNCMVFAIGYGQVCGMTTNRMKRIGLMALLHDIGKVEIPDYLLQASRRLTPDEFEIIKIHPAAGKKMLIEDKFDNDIIIPTFEHHERLNRTGYPNKIKVINESSKLIAIIDIFEALTSWRPYKEIVPPIYALRKMKCMVNRHEIDDKIFESFAQSIVGMDTIISKNSNILNE